MIRNNGSFFFCFGEDGEVELPCIKSRDQRRLITSLKVIISSLSEFESFTILFYDNPLTPHVAVFKRL
jgi:hypothetical protein